MRKIRHRPLNPIIQRKLQESFEQFCKDYPVDCPVTKYHHEMKVGAEWEMRAHDRKDFVSRRNAANAP